MQDAFDVGKCVAEAVDAAELRAGDGTRALGMPIDATPIIAATPRAEETPWRRTVTTVALAKGRVR